jgi:hypothetical protein
LSDGEARGDTTGFTDESWTCHRVGCGCGILFPVLEGPNANIVCREIVLRHWGSIQCQ